MTPEEKAARDREILRRVQAMPFVRQYNDGQITVEELATMLQGIVVMFREEEEEG